ncbi:hypothetical protein [Pseudomonas paeninsulae]|uniref:hypothetical protein n=1 Tax=Pseudomonas paeninsulae TaxID=3110772 RepID=UPI002D79B838|nr:hypothetical protein [Pseudomonas sp. IT1137]
MQEQRYLPALRAHIDQLLREGWVIAERNPLKLQCRGRTCLVMHGMLISEGPLWNHAETERLAAARNPQQASLENADWFELELAAVTG